MFHFYWNFSLFHYLFSQDKKKDKKDKKKDKKNKKGDEEEEEEEEEADEEEEEKTKGGKKDKKKGRIMQWSDPATVYVQRRWSIFVNDIVSISICWRQQL